MDSRDKEELRPSVGVEMNGDYNSNHGRTKTGKKKKASNRRTAMNNRFRHSIGTADSLRGRSTRVSLTSRQIAKGTILKMASIQCSLLTVLLFCVLLLEFKVGKVQQADEFKYTCGGPSFLVLLIFKVLSTLSVTLLVAYQRQVWIATGWTVTRGHVRSNAVLSAFDLAMSFWLLLSMTGKCWSTSTFYVFTFAILIFMIIASIGYIRFLLLLYRRSQLEKAHADTAGGYGEGTGDMHSVVPGNRGDTIDDIEEGNIDTAGDKYGMDPSISNTTWGSSAVVSGNDAESSSIWDNTTPANISSIGSSGMTPELFSQYWESLPQSGAFDCAVDRVPSVIQLQEHLNRRGFSVMASGVVNNTLKLYFSGENTTQHAAPVMFFGELVLETSTMKLGVKFKCDSPEETKQFVQRLQLRDLFFSASG